MWIADQYKLQQHMDSKKKIVDMDFVPIIENTN